jgi:flagellar basal-body rod protein FlgB
LRSALQHGDAPESVGLQTSRSTEPTRMNGNNVNVDDENMNLIETGLRYQLAVDSMNTKFRILRTSMRRDS